MTRREERRRPAPILRARAIYGVGLLLAALCLAWLGGAPGLSVREALLDHVLCGCAALGGSEFGCGRPSGIAHEGDEGARRLKAQGYPEEMIEAMHGSGGQVVKIRPGMSLHGALRLQALKRFANMLALHDEAEARKHHREPLGARSWTNYDWHGDLPPGHPMVTGIQTHDDDHNNFRHARLFIIQGVNFVENKMSDAHWWIETMERGGKIVVIAPEYSPSSQKADYWIPIRPGTDPALQLGVANILFKEKLYDAAFVKRFTDMPLLVRLDTLKLLRASDIFKGYKNRELKGYSVTVQNIDPEAREQWGDFVVWDAKTKNKLDKDRFRQDLGGLMDAYQEVARRLGILPESNIAEFRGPALVK
mgnify:CR=1 FL=1